MISKKEVQHIAQLARLGLSPAEINKLKKHLSSILDYFELLKKVDVSEIKPTSYSVLIENVMRQDKTEKKNQNLELVSQLVKSAPEKKEGYIKVKTVFKS